MEIEKELKPSEIIVSSTDKTGIINYANKEFVKMCEYSKDELYGQPHNIIRHPDMPKAVFRYMWEQLFLKKTVTAYVKNHTKDKKKFYWVKAMIYPVVKNGEIVQLTSYRTRPSREAINQVEQIYKLLNDDTKSIEHNIQIFYNFLKERNLTYEQFINRLNENKQVLNSKLLSINKVKLKADHILFRSAIESLVKKGENNIEIIGSASCAFGKELAKLENEHFAIDDRFLKIKQIHDLIHNQMQVFVDTNVNQRDVIISEVHHNIDELFKIMDDLTDHLIS